MAFRRTIESQYYLSWIKKRNRNSRVRTRGAFRLQSSMMAAASSKSTLVLSDGSRIVKKHHHPFVGVIRLVKMKETVRMKKLVSASSTFTKFEKAKVVQQLKMMVVEEEVYLISLTLKDKERRGK